jgi:hypothetical protein
MTGDEVIPLNVRTKDPDRTVEYARREVHWHLPNDFLVNKVTGERILQGGLSPRQVPTAWVNGLKAARVRARVAKVNRHGVWQTLPLVVEYPCPREHLDESRERFAKVRLLVDPYTGWVSIHEDSCPRCPVEVIEHWLITCPRCVEAGDDLGAHDDHDYDGPFCASEGDESPVAFVSEAMHAMLSGLTSEESEPEPARPEWTKESARAWLDQLVKEDGSYVVPPTLGQAAAWDIVRGIEGHPSQSLIREAQAARKRAAKAPPDE